MLERAAIEHLVDDEELGTLPAPLLGALAEGIKAALDLP